MTSTEFTTKNGTRLSLRYDMLDADQSADAATAMMAMPGTDIVAESDGKAYYLLVYSEIGRDLAKNLARSAAIIFQAPHLEQFAISYTIGDQKDSRPFMVWADRRLGASELAFAATATRWTLHNATTGFLLPFTHQCVSDHQDNPYLTIA